MEMFDTVLKFVLNFSTPQDLLVRVLLALTLYFGWSNWVLRKELRDVTNQQLVLFTTWQKKTENSAKEDKEQVIQLLDRYYTSQADLASALVELRTALSHIIDR